MIATFDVGIKEGVKGVFKRIYRKFFINPVVALNSAHGFTQPLPREG